MGDCSTKGMTYAASSEPDFGTKKGGTALLLIDPQNDFHDSEQHHGSLAVPGAIEDAHRVATMVKAHLKDISQISVTLDSHQKMHIANPFFWKDSKGTHPNPFTVITAEDVKAGKWSPSRPEFLPHALKYTQALKTNKSFVLCVWPEHCLIGTPGHNIVPIINDAIQAWAGHNLDTINYVNKGTNALTEMYSGLKADVVIDRDPSTQLNKAFIDRLKQADRVLVCGQAMSHCVNFTMRHLAANWPKERMKDLVLLEDGASSVAGFEALGKEFVADMKKMGCTVCNVKDAFTVGNK